VGAVVLWVALWTLPWQGFLEALPGSRAVLGLLLFIVPGGCLQQLVSGERSWTRFLTVGFCVSVALVGCLGVLARFAHLSSDFVRLGLMVTGASGILMSWRSLEAPKYPLRSLAKQIAIAVPFLVAIGLALYAGFHESDKTDIDFATHHAQVTDFRDAAQLGFDHFIFGPEVQLSKRFWLSFWTLAQAVVAKNSALHIIELYPVLKQLVLLLAVLAAFALARRMGLPRRWAYLAGIVQLASLSALWGETEGYRAGLTFYKYTLLDNNVATHVSAPVLLRVLVDFLEKPDWRRLLLLCLATCGLLFTHAGMLGLFGVILAIYVALEGVARRWSRAETTALAVLACAAAIPASLRFVSVSQVLPSSLSQMLYKPRAVRILPDGVHYAVDPAYAMYLPFGLVALAGVVAIFWVRRSTSARYILSTLLLLLLTMVPETATLLGAAVTPTILGRTLWFMPFGLAAGFVLMQLFESGEQRSPALAWLGYGVASLLALAWMAESVGSGSRKPRDEVDYSAAEFVEVAHELDRLLDEPTLVLGDRTFNSHLPTLSANAKNITHRNEVQPKSAAYVSHLGAFGKDEARTRIRAWKLISDYDQPGARRLEWLRRSGARYFVSKDRFDARGPPGIGLPPGLQEVKATPGYYIYRVAPPAGS
jgi:hypothetical protein